MMGACSDGKGNRGGKADDLAGQPGRVKTWVKFIFSVYTKTLMKPRSRYGNACSLLRKVT